MKKLYFLLLLLLTIPIVAQSEPVPTLVPPTPIPVTVPVQADTVLTQSTVARLQQTGVLRVGILYNEPAFGEFTISGEVTGFDADLARTLAELWGVELEFVQVTRQNRYDKLRAGDVDLLLAATVHERDIDVEYSQSYRVGKQAMLIRATDEMRSPFALANRRVGYVVGTPAETALNDWINRTRIPIQAQAYYTLDQAYSALFGMEVDAIVARDSHLMRISAPQPASVTIFDDPIMVESYAIAMLRQDIHMRNLVNRTLQYLLSDQDNPNSPSTLETLHGEHFPGEEFPFDALPLYNNIGDDAPTPANFATDVPLPAQYRVPQVINNGVLRVAGVASPDGLTQSQQRIMQVNQGLVEQLAGRWGVRLEYIQGDPISLIEAGQADIAMGIEPDWALVERVDFTQAYLVHGDRLMIPTNRDFERFGDLRNRIVATIIGDSGARDRANMWAESVRVTIRAYETTEDGAARTLLQDSNADVVYGDSLLLLPHLQNNPNDLVLGPSEYSREYLVMAVPRNDIDFRNLVNYTLQEIAREGVLDTLLAPVTPNGETNISIDIWAGSATYLGLTLSR